MPQYTQILVLHSMLIPLFVYYFILFITDDERQTVLGFDAWRAFFWQCCIFTSSN